MTVIASPARNGARLRRTALALGSAGVLALPCVAAAQAIPSPPTREELNVAPQTQAHVPRSRLTVEGGIEHGPCPLADPAFANTKVLFSTVEFSGLPDVPASALDSTWREYAGRELPIATLCEVRDRAATALRGLGYLSAVQVPPQRIQAGGTVHMDVLTARLTEVQLRGEPGPSASLIAAHLAKLTRERWFNSDQAERHLLLLGDLPGYTVRLVLRSADARPGELIGDVVLERTGVELAIGAQNLGSRANGREGAFALLALNDLIGLGDRTTLSYYNSLDLKEQHILRAAEDLALGTSGLRFGASLLVGRSEPRVGVDFTTATFVGDLGLTYPLVRRQAQTLIVGGGLEIANQKLKLGSTLISEDKLRIVHARLDFEATDRASIRGYRGFSLAEPRWRAALLLELRKGIAGLGASNDCAPIANCLPPHVPISNLLADPGAYVARLQGSLEFRPVRRLTLAVAPLAQWSDRPLLSYEQVSLGNYTIGRGFDPGVVLGDRALGASFELRYGSVYPHRTNDFAFEPFVFLDIAKAWLDHSAGIAELHHVLSAGGGVRGRWGDHADFSLIAAVPLERAGFQTTRDDPRVLLTLTTRLLPWRKR